MNARSRLSWLLLSMASVGCVGRLGLDARRDAGVTPSDTDAGPPLELDAGDGPLGTDAGDEPPTPDAGVEPPAPDAGPPPCPAGTTRCGGACIDPTSDPANCGRCGQACAPGGSCDAGSCVGGAGCPPAPAGSSADAVAALERTNELRSAMGAGCQTMIPEINLAAERHCAYYEANRSTPSCIASAHEERPECAMFVAARFDGRMAAAGYRGAPVAENMHFVGNGASAVQGWIDSVYHRNPVLGPWTRDVGYGSAGGCDTSNYGYGEGAPAERVLTYPYPGQRDVPRSFSGAEGPPPPAPDTGWPSGYPITVYAQRATITSHRLTLDGDESDIGHVWLTPSDPRTYTLLRAEHVMYAHDPLLASTTYRVRIEGTGVSGPFALDFTFTTY